MPERDDAAREQVLEPPGGRDDDVGASGGRDLRPEADAAVDRGDPQLAGAGDGLELVDDLARQLAGRREHEAGGTGAPGSMRSTSGMPKARVLPEPVGDWTSRSWPASASRMTICWTGKGWVMSRAASAPTTGLEMPRSANDMIVVSSFYKRFGGDPAAPKRSAAHGGNGTSRVASGQARQENRSSPRLSPTRPGGSGGRARHRAARRGHRRRRGAPSRRGRGWWPSRCGGGGRSFGR